MKIYEQHNCFRVNYPRELSSFSFSLFSFGQKCKSLLEAFLCLSTLVKKKAVNVCLWWWKKELLSGGRRWPKSICRHIQPQCYISVDICCYALLSVPQQWRKFLMFVFLQNVYASATKSSNFLSQYKIDIFICDGGRRKQMNEKDVFMLDWNVFWFLRVFSIPGKLLLRNHNNFHTPNVMDSWRTGESEWKWS